MVERKLMKYPFEAPFPELKKKFYRQCEACFYLGTAGRVKLHTLAVRKEEIFSRWGGEKVGLPA
jgi:hypothetical protein